MSVDGVEFELLPDSAPTVRRASSQITKGMKRVTVSEWPNEHQKESAKGVGCGSAGSNRYERGPDARERGQQVAVLWRPAIRSRSTGTTAEARGLTLRLQLLTRLKPLNFQADFIGDSSLTSDISGLSIEREGCSLQVFDSRPQDCCLGLGHERIPPQSRGDATATLVFISHSLVWITSRHRTLLGLAGIIPALLAALPTHQWGWSVGRACWCDI